MNIAGFLALEAGVGMLRDLPSRSSQSVEEILNDMYNDKK